MTTQNEVSMTIDKNDSIKGKVADLKIQLSFDVVSWCHQHGLKHSVETASHEAEVDNPFGGKRKEKRTTTYEVPSLFDNRDGSRNTVDQAFDFLIELLETGTKGKDAKAAIIATSMRQVNTSLKNNSRDKIKNKAPGKSAQRKLLEEKQTTLVDDMVAAAKSGDLELIQRIAAKQAKVQNDINNL